MATDADSHRRVWARGFHDGMRAKGEEMNTRQKSLIDGLNGVASKVYEAVPVAEGWSAQQINTELYRLGRRIGYDVVEGSLRKLCDSKLVRMPSKTTYQRVSFEETKSATVVQMPQQPPRLDAPMTAPIATVSAVEAKTPIDVLAPLAERVGSMAALLQKLAGDIETAALLVADQLKESEQKSEQLTQLRRLLKSIGGE